ncbi:RodZ family helix-turn-helix domain-containing protein [Halosimplex salinum]|uniref:hypothetical protein n=1 Tax=Halosimplex salinum TaxID=1710538 RepID=UPI000F488BF1|nr:hypothetical protein [Halosimplex salinum]
MDDDRRRYLGLVAGVAAGFGGCLASDDATDASSTATPTDTPAETPTEARSPTSTGTATDGSTRTPSGTPADPSLVLDPGDPSGDAPLTVYPPKLASILRGAATGDGPVRAAADAFVYAPEPVLPAFDAVEIVDPVGDAGGVYEISAEGGPRHRMGLKAEEATPPDDASVTPVSEIPGAHREVVVEALDDSRDWPSVYPETETGEWVREHFFGEYVSQKGTTYRGSEIHATDAVFFSTEVWYVLTLSPVDDADDPVELRLPEVESSVRTVVDGALQDWKKTAGTPAVSGPPVSEAVHEFADDTARLLTNTHAYEVSVEPWDDESE